MPRRCVETLPETDIPRKKSKLVDDVDSVDLSFCDDEALPPGTVFTDILQKQWRIGKPIGRGSFGRIYLASDEVDKEVTKHTAKYVVKIEPHSNGPLFVEIHCLIRSAQADKVREWRIHNRQKRLGMPIYIASGSFTDRNTDSKFRFLVLPRYDIDLQKIISRGRALDLRNTLLLAIQILDVLEYLHNQGYTHSDIKSSNLMLGFDRNDFLDTKTKDKQKRARTRGKNYYNDEDFVLEKRKIEKRRQKHAFNLRRINMVNYEDLTSSVCSDDAYQELDDQSDDYSSDEGFHSDQSKHSKRNKVANNKTTVDINNEAILSQSNGQIYLLDYGLASKFIDGEGNHKEFDMDARKAHDGTLEYSSRDSHVGAHSRRSDLETLGYNIIDWLTGMLPWKTVELLSEPDLVHKLKIHYMDNVKNFLTACFKNDNYPEFIEKYLVYVRDLDFQEKPDYDYCRSIFRDEYVRNKFGDDLNLDFAESSRRFVNRNQKIRKKINWNEVQKVFETENITSLENNLKLEIIKQTLNSSSDGERKPCSVRNFYVSDAELIANLKKSLLPQEIYGKKISPKNLRSNKRNMKKRKGKSSIGKFGNFMGSARQFTWAEILAGNPEDLLRKDRNANADSEDEDDDCKYRLKIESDDESGFLNKEYPNPTYAMKEILTKFKKKTVKKDEFENRIEGYTPAMMNVLKLKEARKLKEMETNTVPTITPRTRSGRTKRNLTTNIPKIGMQNLVNFEPRVCVSPLTADKYPSSRLIKKTVVKTRASPKKRVTTRSKSACRSAVSKRGRDVPPVYTKTRSSSRHRLRVKK